jgi:hypothetical protein
MLSPLRISAAIRACDFVLLSSAAAALSFVQARGEWSGDFMDLIQWLPLTQRQLTLILTIQRCPALSDCLPA